MHENTENIQESEKIWLWPIIYLSTTVDTPQSSSQKPYKREILQAHGTSNYGI